MNNSKINHDTEENKNKPSAIVSGIGAWLGRTRFVVLIAVAAVMLIALSLFLLGTVEAFRSIWTAWDKMFSGQLNAAYLTVEFLEVVTVMMKAVVFYLIGVGLFSLFISPLNVTVALGVLTLSDLEEKIINVIVVILSVTFLQHFILWVDPLQTMYNAASLAMVVIALMLFQHFRQWVREDQKKESPNIQAKAQKEMFEKDEEKHRITDDEIKKDED
ncbi:MAG: YqhA family protein [Chitinophagaceae bacterium]